MKIIKLYFELFNWSLRISNFQGGHKCRQCRTHISLFLSLFQTLVSKYYYLNLLLFDIFYNFIDIMVYNYTSYYKYYYMYC